MIPGGARATVFSILFLTPLCGCGVTMESVDARAVRSPRREDAVAVYTPETGQPTRPMVTVARFSWRTQGHRQFGFYHLRVLRETARNAGCDAVIVGREEMEYDEVLCGRHHTVPVPCITRYPARCVRFE